MGRHSAAEEDEDQDAGAPAGVIVEAADAPRGRHAVVAAPAEFEPAGAEPDEPEPDEPEPAAAPRARRESSTRADLRLLRADPALRARCVAAVLAPFIVYTVVLIAIGRTDLYLLWVIAPTVVAGVAAGAFLDIAHRRAPAAAPPAAVPAASGAGAGAVAGQSADETERLPPP